RQPRSPGRQWRPPRGPGRRPPVAGRRTQVHRPAQVPALVGRGEGDRGLAQCADRRGPTGVTFPQPFPRFPACATLEQTMNAIRPNPAGPLRILGLDPGLRRTGWGVVEAHGARLSHVAHGVIAPKDSLPFAERLLILFDAIAEVIALHAPTRRRWRRPS